MFLSIEKVLPLVAEEKNNNSTILLRAVMFNIVNVFFDKLVIVIVSSMQAITSDIFYLPGEQQLMLLPRS